jgi:FkbM family methyltransferase
VKPHRGVVLISALSLAAALVVFYSPIRLFSLVIAGRSDACPLRNAMQSDRNLVTQIALKDRILHESKLLQEDERGFHQWQTPNGTYWIPEGSDFVLPFNLAEQERKIYGSGDQFVKPGDTVLDCGANVGVFTTEALKAGAKLVVAIEPAPENLECLRRNFAAEVESGRVIIYPKGVWDKDDFLPLNVDAHNSAADTFVLHPPNAEMTTQKLPLTTIDNLVSELHLERVDFIKMDIEGAEPKALAGARETLAKFHPRLSVSAYHQPDHPVLIPKVVKSGWAGYQTECGPCSVDNAQIRPDILWFH